MLLQVTDFSPYPCSQTPVGLVKTFLDSRSKGLSNWLSKMYITFFPQPSPPEPQVLIHPLKPIDESDSGFKMILKYQVPEAVKYWSISLKFTKDISTRNFNIDKAKVVPQKEPTSDSFCLGPQPYNRKLNAKCVLRLEFNCHKAQLYEAAPNAFFVFHPNSTKCEDFDLPKPGPAVPK